MSYIYFLLALFFLSFRTYGDDSGPAAPALEDLMGRMDFSVPQSPAFTILGVTPDEVINPTSYRSLALSLAEGVDASGNPQSGIAIDTKPYFLARGNSITLEDYRTDTMVRQLSRMQLSFATASGDDDSNAERYGLSLRLTPWDTGDPRMDYNLGDPGDVNTLEGCRRDLLALDDDAESLNEEMTEAEKDASEAKKEASKKSLIEANKKCLTASAKRSWNASSWDIGIAGYRSESDNGSSENGYSAWSSAAIKLGTGGQFIGHVRIGNSDLKPFTENSPDQSANSSRTMTIGGRLRYGNERGAFMIELAHKEIDADSGDRDGEQYLVGAEYRIFDGFWLQLAVGDASGNLSDSGTIYTGQLRYSISDTRLLQ